MNRRRLLRRWLLASLLLRLALWVPVARYHVPEVYDEVGYADRARAVAACVASLLHGRAPAAADVAAAYDRGFQPPLHPLLLGLWSLPGGGRTGWLRLWPVLLTALATPLAWRLGYRLGGRRAADAAAALHLLSPTVTFFSHTLWSEPLFVLLLLGGLDRLLAAAGIGDAGGDPPGNRGRLAVAAGVLLGLAAVTRAEGLPVLLAAALWLGWREPRRRAATLLLAGLLPLLAWEGVLVARERRPVALTTSAGLNLLMGNIPEVAPAAGSAWRDPAVQAPYRARAAALADSLGTGFDAACRRLALAEIRRDPGGAVARALGRLRLYAAPDLFPVRHVAQAAYPPLPGAALVATWLAVTLFYLGLLVLGTVSLPLLPAPLRSLGGLLLAALLLPPLATVAFTRLHFPLLVLLMPVAGLGWARWRTPGGPRRFPARGALAVAVALVVASLSAVPVQLRCQLEPSWFHHGTLDRAGALLGVAPRYRDRVMVRRPPGLRDGAAMVIVAGDTLRWDPAGEAWIAVSVPAAPGRPPRLTLADPVAGVRVTWQPVRREAWHRWQPVPGTGTGPGRPAYRWAGAG